MEEAQNHSARSRLRFLPVLAVIGAVIGLAIVPPPAAAQPLGKKFHFHISAYGCREFNALFPGDFPIYLGSWNVGVDYGDSLVSADSNLGAGLSGGVSFLSEEFLFKRPALFYLEGFYIPGMHFPGMIETYMSTHFDGTDSDMGRALQTEQTTKLWGLNFGLIYFPFLNVPLGLELSLGIASGRQEFTSGSLKGFAKSFTYVNGFGGSDATVNFGTGHFSRGDAGFTGGLGLRYYATDFLSIDLIYRYFAIATLSNEKNVGQAGNTIYYTGSSNDGFGTVLSGGLTIYF
jgi:hypothetical protein